MSFRICEFMGTMRYHKFHLGMKTNQVKPQKRRGTMKGEEHTTDKAHLLLKAKFWKKEENEFLISSC